MSLCLKDLKIEVTQKCTLNCKHCSSNSNKQSVMSITADKCNEILDDAINLGVKNITFSVYWKYTTGWKLTGPMDKYNLIYRRQ